MWARGDMKIQIPQKLGLTPLFGLDPKKGCPVGTVWGEGEGGDDGGCARS